MARRRCLGSRQTGLTTEVFYHSNKGREKIWIPHVNEKKSWLILKNGNDLNKAKSIFSDLSIKLTTEGQTTSGSSPGF